MTVLRDERVRTWWLLAAAVLASCSAPTRSSLDEQAVSANACTAVTMSAPSNDFVLAPGAPLTLTGVATCPAGQTPEYQYWVKLYADANWTRLTPKGTYVPGSATWTPPDDRHWCVTVVARAVGAPEDYQVRASSRCSAPRCGNGEIERGEQCDDGNVVDGDGCNSNCTIAACGNGIVDAGEQCDDGNTRDYDGCDATCHLGDITYLKASNTGSGDYFGSGVALSRDGATLAVGAFGEAGAGTGVGAPNNDNAINAGAVYVYARAGAGWTAPVYIKASNAARLHSFGYAVALSADGSTLAVGAPGEDSGTGSPTDHSAYFAGAVYIFTRSGGAWTQQAYLKTAHPDPNDAFGTVIALSDDGSTLVATAPKESSDARGINGDEANNNAWGSGAAYVFTRTGTAWTQQAYLKASNANDHDGFGDVYSVGLTGDGNTLVIGASCEASDATGIDGDASRNVATCAGAAYVFQRSAGAWTETHYLKASNTGAGDQFGVSATLSHDGSTLAIGANREASAATGVGGDQSDDSTQDVGAVYLFARDGATWRQTTYVKATNAGIYDWFGYRVALNDDGSQLAVTAPSEASGAKGRNGDQSDNSVLASGALYTYARCGATWTATGYIKAPNTEFADQFGTRLAMLNDGTIAVAAIAEDGSSTGVGGNLADNGAQSAGAVYLYRPVAPICAPSSITYIKASNTGAGDAFGSSVALSADGATLAVGASYEDGASAGVGAPSSEGATDAGAVYVYQRTSAGWGPPIYIKSSAPRADHQFGARVALSADGTTLAVGAPGDDNGTSSPYGSGSPFAGAVYIFTRSGSTWTQQAYLKAAYPHAGDLFGGFLALSSDGSTLAVTAALEDSGATGIDGDQTDRSAPEAGAAYIFSRIGTAWTQSAYIKASNTGVEDDFGYGVGLSGDGNTLVIGAPGESGGSSGIDGEQGGAVARYSGAAYVFEREAGVWSQRHYLKASNAGAYDQFGYGAAISRDGATIAIGAPGELSAVSNGGDPLDDSAWGAGAAYVFARDGATWRETAYVKAINTDAGDNFGYSVALIDDGSVLAVTAPYEAGAGRGRDADPSDDSLTFGGALYTYARGASGWSPTAYLKASNTDNLDQLGNGLAIAGDGTLACSAVAEDGSTSGVGGNQADNAAANAGAVYVYR